MITTNDIKLKERDPNVKKKLKMITTNETKPTGFSVPKRKKAQSKNVITTSNVDKFMATRKKEIPIEKRAATMRQKKLDAEIKVNEELYKERPDPASRGAEA